MHVYLVSHYFALSVEDTILMMKIWLIHSGKNKFTVRMLHPIEVITVSKRMAIVDVGSLAEIPTELQVHQAISELYKKEEFSDKYSYIRFSFGMIDYDGLSRLLTYYEYIPLKGKIAEEKLWLQQSKQDCEGLGVNIDQINQYFKNHVWSTNSYNPVIFVRNVVGTRWLSDDVIDIVFDIINTMYIDTICFLCKPTRICIPLLG